VPKEKKLEFDGLPEGAIILDKEEKKGLEGWSAIDWFWAIIGTAIGAALSIGTQEIFHLSKEWSYVPWFGGLAIVIFTFRKINENKKKKKSQSKDAIKRRYFS